MKKDNAASSGSALTAIGLSVTATFLAIFAANNQSWLRFVALGMALVLIVAAGLLIGRSTVETHKSKQGEQ